MNFGNMNKVAKIFSSKSSSTTSSELPPPPSQLWRITIKTFPRKQWLPVVIQSRLPDSVKKLQYIPYIWNTTGDSTLYHFENNDKER